MDQPARQAWMEVAYLGLIAYITAVARSQSFTTQQVRAALPELPQPPDTRAWGSVVLRASRAGLIRKIGTRSVRNSSRHQGLVTVWERAR